MRHKRYRGLVQLFEYEGERKGNVFVSRTESWLIEVSEDRCVTEWETDDDFCSSEFSFLPAEFVE